MNLFKKLVSAAYLPWLFLLAGVDLFFTFLVWLANPDALHILVPVILLFGLILFSAIFLFAQYRLRMQQRAFLDFLKNPTTESMQEVLSTQDSALYPAMLELLEHVLLQTKELADRQTQLDVYQEFIEEWTHNIKTPLSLATLVLDNHKGEMSPYVYQRMTHVKQEIQTDVDMILYYARLQGAHVEYRFENIKLRPFIEEILQNYQEQIKETNITVETNCPDVTFISDRKVLTFMLSQILNNAFQYTPRETGKIRICGWVGDPGDSNQEPPVSAVGNTVRSQHSRSAALHLTISDNGCGVPEEDIPFLFDKGFTGNHPDRQNATGMGLYLVAKYAEALAIEVSVGSKSADSHFQSSFTIELVFHI